jgi:hypothetical protein
VAALGCAQIAAEPVHGELIDLEHFVDGYGLELLVIPASRQ